MDPEALARAIPDLDLDHSWDLPPERAIELARECEAAGLAVDARVSNSEGGSVNTQRSTAVYGNSLGFLGGYSSTSHSVSCSLIAQQGEDMQRDYWYTVARDPARPRGRREHRTHRGGARAGAPRRAAPHHPQGPRRLYARLARGLFRHFVGAISGSSQYRKSSFLLDAAGEQVFPKFLSMQERPHILKGLASSPFDDEGAATHDRELVRAGVLDGYVLGSYSARRLGLKSTGNAGGIHNLIVSSAEPALDAQAFLKRLGTGLLVTELMGQGVNGVTGDYSRGASGFWVQDGAIAFPVAGNHHRGQPAADVPGHRRARQRRRCARRHPHRFGPHRGDDHRRGVGGLRFDSGRFKADLRHRQCREGAASATAGTILVPRRWPLSANSGH